MDRSVCLPSVLSSVSPSSLPSHLCPPLLPFALLYVYPFSLTPFLDLFLILFHLLVYCSFSFTIRTVVLFVLLYFPFSRSYFFLYFRLPQFHRLDLVFLLLSLPCCFRLSSRTLVTFLSCFSLSVFYSFFISSYFSSSCFHHQTLFPSSSSFSSHKLFCLSFVHSTFP